MASKQDTQNENCKPSNDNLIKLPLSSDMYHSLEKLLQWAIDHSDRIIQEAAYSPNVKDSDIARMKEIRETYQETLHRMLSLYKANYKHAIPDPPGRHNTK